MPATRIDIGQEMQRRGSKLSGELNRLAGKNGRNLHTDAGMRRFLDRLFGTGGWVYDPDADLWIVCDPRHSGPGRGFLAIERGGNWRSIVLRERVLQ